MQFAYGEDGIDVMNVSYLREFGFLSRNAQRFAQQLNLEQALQATGLSHWEEESRALVKYAACQLPVCLPACLPAHPSVRPSGCPPVCLSIHLSVCLPALLVCLPACLFVRLSACFSICLSV